METLTVNFIINTRKGKGNIFMLHTIIKENSYQDSINLMLLTNSVNGLDGVNKSSIMMGTDANKRTIH